MEGLIEDPLASVESTAESRPGVFPDAVCGVDGTHGSFAAVEQAAALVGTGGSLTLLAVTAVSGAGRYRTAAISPQRVDRVLARAARIAQAAGAHTARVIEPSGPPANLLLRDSAGHGLLAIGAPYASSLGGMLVGGVASAALEAFTIPLLTARPQHGHAAFAERIVVASDGSEDSEEVVGLAQRMREALGSRIVLVHALGAESQSHPHRIERQAQMLGLSAGAGELRIEAGGARETILRAATDTDASLILMGSRRRGGLAALSGVSTHAVHEAPCSVLLVPPR